MKKIIIVTMTLILSITFCFSQEMIKIPGTNFHRYYQLINIPGKNYKMLKTEVTQELYEAVMGENPSHFEGENLPVENVNIWDVIYFCNKLSKLKGLTPVYSVNGTTDFTKWDYIPHKDEYIDDKMNNYGATYIYCNEYANGYRLPTIEEWQYAAKGGDDFEYAGSNNLDEVGWYDNVEFPDDYAEYKKYKTASERNAHTKSVGRKKANGFGLYDMSGNVWEMCGKLFLFSGESTPIFNRYISGGSYRDEKKLCKIHIYEALYNERRSDVGFRIVRNAY
ncbi:MAG: SUMF1/EgtB/PvdO family nonheme iron enzyme [Spirochaetaceae bacterium]|nr:SUMF1/EgtB/PvdO family nonheme iron enzyme [Spirochaetaceae bacterium]MBR4824646.1 SUMF1/EgtB/PvdO family nonheme iron enzyme [Spirochaetaceae bacterium]